MKLKVLKLIILISTVLPQMVYAQTRYQIMSGGAEVKDSQTGLVWQRCAAGMLWQGSKCTGTAKNFTHQEALDYAKSLSESTSVAWRLPGVHELAGLVDDKRVDPAIDIKTFPNTPSNWFWTAQVRSGDSSYAWVVYFSNGVVASIQRSGSSRVRLVR